jgi:hypothetical protein
LLNVRRQQLVAWARGRIVRTIVHDFDYVWESTSDWPADSIEQYISTPRARCRQWILRIRAPCALRDVRVSGPGFLTTNKWKYDQYGLVEVSGPADARAAIDVSLERVRVRHAVHCNGVRAVCAARLAMRGCRVAGCKRNGVIVKARLRTRCCLSRALECSRSCQYCA